MQEKVAVFFYVANGQANKNVCNKEREFSFVDYFGKNGKTAPLKTAESDPLKTV
jgi:hypothetical protein